MPEETLPNQENQNLASQGQALETNHQPIVRNEKPAGKSPVLKFVMLGMLFIFGLALMVGAYFMGQKSDENSNAYSPTPAASSTQTPIDDTTDWMTYEGDRFSFKYPNEWTAVNPYAGTESVELRPSNYAQEKNVDPIFLLIYENPENLTLENWNKKEDEKSDRGSFYYNSDTKKGNFPGIESYINENAHCAPFDCKQVIFIGNNKIYILNNIELSFGDGTSYAYTIEDNKNFKLIFDQILSTFKFTDSTSTTDTSDWKTYTSIAGDFSLSYPDSWTVLDDKKSEVPENGTVTIVFGPNITSLTEDKNTRLVIQMQKPDASTGITNAKSYIISISKVKTPSTYTVDGINAYKANYSDTGTAYEIITLDKDNNIYSINFGQNSVPNISQSDQKVFEEIISTLKFN